MSARALDVLPHLWKAPAAPLSWETAFEWFLGVPMTVVLIIITAWVLRWLVHRGIDRFVDSMVERKARNQTIGAVDPVPTAQLPIIHRYGRKAARAISQSGLLATERQRARITTLGSVMRSVASIVIWSVAALMIGSQLGLDMTPVLASAGVGGVALGFGAQSLVKDFLSGIFMILEDQYGVGDVIDTGEVVGTVEEVTLRITRLRDAEGVVWYVRNGEIVRVANKSQGWTTGIIDIPVAPDEDPMAVTAILRAEMKRMYQEPEWAEVLLAEPSVAGVESINAGAMSIRVFAKCQPNQHWGAQREIRERGKVALSQAGIRGPVWVPGTDEGRRSGA
ncbi:mechanosensitive ion channel family protein [Gephyromycinifex aptenodytis]|uniref:mechanosensitive ion channel family protein n=1 Tax=Gephyromycinifex aptenodytis TaxID=2716227 RepID=UPI001447B499|nr:mechanosensitive ion channel family protein [Gephyromycinifex aptenodytis]